MSCAAKTVLLTRFFPQIKDMLANPDAYASAAPAATEAAPAAEDAKPAEKEEEKEESDDDMGFGLFD